MREDAAAAERPTALSGFGEHKEMSQANRLLQLLADGKVHRTDEILEKVYGGSHLGIARVGARIWDLKSRGHKIIGWKDPDHPSLYFYQLLFAQSTEKPKPPEPPRKVEAPERRQGALLPRP